MKFQAEKNAIKKRIFIKVLIKSHNEKTNTELIIQRKTVMITKKIFTCIQLFFFIFVISMVSSAMADEDCIEDKVLPPLHEAMEDLGTASDHIAGFSLVERNKGRIALLGAHAHVAGAELKLYLCHLHDLNLVDFFGEIPEEDKKTLGELLAYLASHIPEVMEIFTPFVHSGLEALKVETLLLIAQASIAFVELQTVGMLDSGAVKTIPRITSLLEFICTGLEDGFGDGAGDE